MNRNFPFEKIEPCQHCGRDILCVVIEFGGLEAADLRDYVYAPANGDPNDEMFVCAGCRVATGMDD